jgi:hypothetical protein
MNTFLHLKTVFIKLIHAKLRLAREKSQRRERDDQITTRSTLPLQNT